MSKPMPTTDLCDANEGALADGSLRVFDPGLIALGGRVAFAGPATTLKVFEDNLLIADTVKTPGEGRVLVVDAGGSRRCAVFGGNLAATAARNGWGGVIINGCARDAGEIDATDIGVRALALHPRRSGEAGRRPTRCRGGVPRRDGAAGRVDLRRRRRRAGQFDGAGHQGRAWIAHARARRQQAPATSRDRQAERGEGEIAPIAFTRGLQPLRLQRVASPASHPTSRGIRSRLACRSSR